MMRSEEDEMWGQLGSGSVSQDMNQRIRWIETLADQERYPHELY
jgi:hypothetical protein